MEKILLKHPEGKKGVSMDKVKYEALKTSFLACLKTKKVAPFQELLSDVEKDLEKRKVKIEGKLEWNLFWVTLNLVATKQLVKNKTLSPITYTLPK